MVKLYYGVEVNLPDGSYQFHKGCYGREEGSELVVVDETTGVIEARYLTNAGWENRLR
jgi:hypothetical protein